MPSIPSNNNSSPLSLVDETLVNIKKSSAIGVVVGATAALALTVSAVSSIITCHLEQGSFQSHSAFERGLYDCSGPSYYESRSLVISTAYNTTLCLFGVKTAYMMVRESLSTLNS